MCFEMGNVIHNHEAVPENLRQQLAVAVRSIQWSYAIFWSLSPSQHGVLEWLDGYYNGDIKTRKTVQAMGLKADRIGLQRSEQLRELFESLSEGESEQQAKRPSAALSPEDLSDAEWYYLVCMSFVFNSGQGLPGRTLATGQAIWLCDASYADSEVFSRSLLAKSASIQTVVCFPHLGGVIELGVTELVPEDASLLQRVKASLLELSKPVCTEKSLSIPQNTDDDRDPMSTKVDHDVVDTLSLENLYSPTEDIKLEEGMNILHDNIHEEFTMDSLDECSNGCEHNHQTEDSFMLEGVNGGASQVQSWHFMEDDLSNGAQDSMNSSDCISEAFANQEKALCSSNCEHGNHGLKQLQDSNHTKLSSLDLGDGHDLFYRRTISVVLRSSCKMVENTHSHGCDCKASFMSWKKGGQLDSHRARGSQKMLKKILCTIPLMHGSLKPEKENGGKDWLGKLGNDDVCMGNVFPEKKKENEKFLVLRSMVPSISEIDKSSILSDTIKYLKELEARVEELESCMDSTELEAESRRKYADVIEKTSDNHDKKKIESGKKVWLSKRKARDVIDENDPELNMVAIKEGPSQYVKVSMKGQEVQIELRCAFREYILLDIMDAINNLHLDAHTVQSSTLDGVLTVTLKSKFRGKAVAPVGMIKQAICKVTGKC